MSDFKCNNCDAEVSSEIATTSRIGCCPICGCDTLLYNRMRELAGHWIHCKNEPKHNWEDCKMKNYKEPSLNMNRVIKYRAWNTRKEKMLSTDKDGWAYFAPLLHSGEGSIYIPMQYTGLKDKNGVEIYEGDIVKTQYGEEYRNHIVEWIEYGYFNPMTALLPRVPEDTKYYMETNKIREFEVIGNKFVHPELLK